MQVKLNGEHREITVATLDQLVSSCNLDPQAVVIELNGVIVQKEAWGTTVLNSGDQVEIVSFVGGG